MDLLFVYNEKEKNRKVFWGRLSILISTGEEDWDEIDNGETHLVRCIRQDLDLEKTLMLGKLKAGEGDDRGWDGRITSPTWRTFVWPSSGSWWWTEKPDMLQSPGLQRVRHDWAIELNWPEGPLWRRVALWTPFPRNYFPSVLFPGFPRPQVLIHNPPWHSPILP